MNTFMAHRASHINRGETTSPRFVPTAQVACVGLACWACRVSLQLVSRRTDTTIANSVASSVVCRVSLSARLRNRASDTGRGRSFAHLPCVGHSLTFFFSSIGGLAENPDDDSSDDPHNSLRPRPPMPVRIGRAGTRLGGRAAWRLVDDDVCLSSIPEGWEGYAGDAHLWKRTAHAVIEIAGYKYPRPAPVQHFLLHLHHLHLCLRLRLHLHTHFHNLLPP